MENKKADFRRDIDKIFSPFKSRVEELVKDELVSISAGSSVLAAAQIMEKEGVGSLVVMRGGMAVGIVTKGDMVRRVIAKGKISTTGIDEVMSPNIISIQKGEVLFDGLMLMIQHGIGHLLITNDGKPVGIISERDWLVYQERHLAVSLWEIERAESMGELAMLKERANSLVRKLFDEESAPESLTEHITEINDRISRRIINLVLREMGEEPPVPFAWISMGSEGRREQTLSTDQDNGLVFADVEPERLEEVTGWFLRFAEQVVAGMEECGYPRCRGNTMASNPKLCLPLSGWKRDFRNLTNWAGPDDLLRAHIFFDLRCLYGEESLVDAMWKEIFILLDENKAFLKTLAGSEKIFGLVPVYNMDWKIRAFFGLLPPPINIKERALGPLVRCIRVLALLSKSSETNSLQRLEAIRASGLIPEGLVDDARFAFNFLIMLRMRQNIQQHKKGKELHHIIDFKQLKRLEGRFFVDALKTIRELEKYMGGHFGGLISG